MITLWLGNVDKTHSRRFDQFGVDYHHHNIDNTCNREKDLETMTSLVDYSFEARNRHCQGLRSPVRMMEGEDKHLSTTTRCLHDEVMEYMCTTIT